MQQSIRTRLMIILVALMTVSFLLLGWLLSGSLEQLFQQITRDRLVAEARQLKVALEPALLAADNPQAMIVASGQQADVRITLVQAATGVVLADSVSDPATMDNHGDRPEVTAAIASGLGWSLRASPTLGQTMLYVAVPGPQLATGETILRLSLPLSEMQSANLRLWQIIGSGLVLLLLLSLGVAIWISRNFSRPIEQITLAAQKLARGDLHLQVPVNRSDELGRLAASLNRLARSNVERVQELVAAKAQLETVIGNTVSGIFLLDRRGTVLLSNPAAMQMLGFDPDELPCNHWQLSRNFEMSQALDKALAGMDHFKQDISVNTPQEKVLELNVVPLPAQDRYVAVFYDVSESRRLAAIRADLVANVSHELKTPVTSIHGFAETLLQGALEDERARPRFVEIIYRESGRLLRLVNDLLDLSRLELDPRAIEKHPINLVKTVEDAVERSALKAEEKQLGLKPMVGVERAELQGDDYRLGQAVGNLIDNAIKYTPPGGEIRVNLQYEKGAFVISVRDTGIGIEPEHLDRVFERFYRTDKARSRQHGGTGLGLAIVKHIVELHGGQVWAESRLGEGSLFRIRLPAQDSGDSH